MRAVATVEFDSVSFCPDVALDVPGLGEYKVPEYVEEVDEVHPDDVLDFDPNLPYIMTPLKDKM